jgi:predicted outer membrane repeat protein
MTLSNCTFSSNAAETEGGAILSQLSTLNLINSILWGDSPAEFNVDPHRTVTYSDIQGGYAGTGNINANPWFVDATNGNLRLLIISPAIDAGDNTAVPPTVITDREGNPRFVDVPIIPDSGNGIPPIADMGAYEVQGNIYFVDVEASGNNDGTSWQDAFTELQPALDAAVGGGKIVVAAGTYYPTSNTVESMIRGSNHSR